MKKSNLLNPIGFVLAFLLLALFTACPIENEDPDPPTNELGTILWVYDDFSVFPEEVDPVSISGPAIGSDGTIYVASYDKVGATWQNARVHAINPDSTFKWASPELEGADVTAPVVGPDVTIFVICNTTVYAFNPGNGSITWSYQPPADNNEQHGIGWLSLGNDGQVFFAHIASGAYARKIYALDSDGQVIWKRDVDWGANNLTVGIDGTLFTYWEKNGAIKTYSALDPTNGSIIWSIVLEGYPRATAVSPDGDLILSQYFPDKLIKIDGVTGAIIWETDALSGFPTVSANGLIYLINGDLYCYNNANGTLKWQSGPYYGNMGRSAIDVDGNCYGSLSDHGEGNFQVYKPDGNAKWAIHQAMTGTHCPTIGSNNVIYVTVASVPKATLYAIQGDNALAPNGWARDAGGNGNTRNINMH